MNVEGINVPDHLIDHALLGVDHKRGFTFHDLQQAMIAAGIDLDPSYRCADRTLQRLRKKGALVFKGGKWFAHGQ